MARIINVVLTFLTVALILMSPEAFAQQVRVNASVTSQTVGTEEAVSYRIQVEGASPSNVQRPVAPEAQGLQLIQPVPSTQQSVSIVNGNMTQSVSYEWRYRPESEGAAQIAAAEVLVDGTEYRTEPIAITVVPQSQRPQRQAQRRDPFSPFNSLMRPAPEPERTAPAISEQDIFIRAIPSDRSVFRNEQVNIEYHLYFREGMQLRQSRLADSWDAEGFWREELDVERRPIPKTVVENGRRFNTIVLKRVAVFPTRTGSLTVDPLKIEAEAYAPSRSLDPFDQFFSFRPRYEPVQVASDPVTIEVSDLPANAPPDFLGAVGAFRAEARVDRAEVEVGEPIQVTLTISGAGNIATIEPPNFQPPGVFEQYDPQVDTRIERNGTQIRGSKTLTYVLVPRSNGVFQIPDVTLSVFNPDRGRYESLNPRPTTVRVSGSASTPAATLTTTSGLPVDDIAGLLVNANAWSRVNPVPVHRASWAYVLLAIPLLLLVGMLMYQRHVDKISGDLTYARNRRAHPVAKKHLKRAEQLLAQNDARAFYEEIERALLSFIGNRLNIADKGLTYQQLGVELTRHGVSAEVQERLIALLNECDRVRYAPILPDQQAMNTACDRASHIIVLLDQVFSGK